MEDLPSEIVEIIMSHLDSIDRMHLTFTSKYFYSFQYTRKFWKHMTLNDLPQSHYLRGLKSLKGGRDEWRDRFITGREVAYELERFAKCTCRGLFNDFRTLWYVSYLPYDDPYNALIIRVSYQVRDAFLMVLCSALTPGVDKIPVVDMSPQIVIAAFYAAIDMGAYRDLMEIEKKAELNLKNRLRRLHDVYQTKSEEIWMKIYNWIQEVMRVNPVTGLKELWTLIFNADSVRKDFACRSVFNHWFSSSKNTSVPHYIPVISPDGSHLGFMF